MTLREARPARAAQAHTGPALLTFLGGVGTITGSKLLVLSVTARHRFTSSHQPADSPSRQPGKNEHLLPHVPHICRWLGGTAPGERR